MATSTDDPWATTVQAFREAWRDHTCDWEQFVASYSGIQVDPAAVAALEFWTGDHPAPGDDNPADLPSIGDRSPNDVDILLSYLHSLVAADQESWFALGLMLERRIGSMNPAERRLLALWHRIGSERGWL